MGTYVAAVGRRRPSPEPANRVEDEAGGTSESIVGRPQDPAISNEETDEPCQIVALPPTIDIALAEADGPSPQEGTVGPHVAHPHPDLWFSVTETQVTNLVLDEDCPA